MSGQSLSKAAARKRLIGGATAFAQRTVMEERYPFYYDIEKAIQQSGVVIEDDRPTEEQIVEIAEHFSQPIIAAFHRSAHLQPFLEGYDLRNEGLNSPTLWHAYLSGGSDYMFEIASMAQDHVVNLSNEIQARQIAHDRAQSSAIDQGAFFNLPSATADMEMWARLATWTLEEAVALSLGKNPEVVDATALQPYLDQQSPFAREYARRLKMAQRAVDGGVLVPPLKPAAFCEWCESSGLDVHGELRALLSASLAKAATLEALQDEVTKLRQHIASLEAQIAHQSANFPATRRLGSMQKLMLGMAMRGFHHTVGGNSTANMAIAKALSELDLAVGRDTVKDLLDEAATDLNYSGPPKYDTKVKTKG